MISQTPAMRRQAYDLRQAGHSDAEVARRIGVSTGTVWSLIMAGARMAKWDEAQRRGRVQRAMTVFVAACILRDLR